VPTPARCGLDDPEGSHDAGFMAAQERQAGRVAHRPLPSMMMPT